MTDDEMQNLIDRQAKVQEQLDHLSAWDLDSRLEMAMDAYRLADIRLAEKVCQADDEVDGGHGGMGESETNCKQNHAYQHPDEQHGGIACFSLQGGSLLFKKRNVRNLAVAFVGRKNDNQLPDCDDGTGDE